MTNLEIKEKYISENSVTSCPMCGGIAGKDDEYNYYAEQVLAIQDLTRADERERVIGEIDLEQILIRLDMVRKCGTCVRCDEMLEYITDKLNSLKENK